MDDFACSLLAWFDRHGRHDLPWQHPRTPYRVWVSEVMLQQTQVRTVIPYFGRFVAALPDIATLAAAPLDRVLALWSGLGYYSRARNLHRAALACVDRFDGRLPRDASDLASLPGIGRSTAAAILAQAHDEPHAILDGNVRRVLARFHAIGGWPGSSETQRVLWRHAERHTPGERAADYTQAIMDLGALVCVRGKPLCGSCPLADACIARRDGLTTQLPTPKPARTLPERSTMMLIVRDGEGRILLDRRPPTGVWASLWSLPECATIEDACSSLPGRHALDARLIGAHPAFTHTFSHFRLRITPLLMRARSAPAHVADDASDRAWFSHPDLAGLGLPAPVRKLLETLTEENRSCEPCIA